MKLSSIAFQITVLAGLASAEVQFDFDPTLLPEGHTNVRVEGCTVTFQGVSQGCDEATVSSGGVPFMYQAVFQSDDIWSAGYFTRLTLIFECGGEDHDYDLIPLVPFQLTYFPGPANPPLSPTVWSEVDITLDCDPVADAEDGPVAFRLGEAWPNPFNPSTTIEFDLAATGNARLDVYSILGRKVATVVNGMLGAGSHRVVFDGAGLASGVYFYTLETEGLTATRKMILLK